MTIIGKIAPAEMIRRDFENLKRQERLETTRDIESLIYMQSIEGRSHNGAGAFGKRSYVNTTIDDIVRALGLKPGSVKTKRQILIDQVIKFAKKVCEGGSPSTLLDEKGKPFLGWPGLKGRTVNPHDVMKGLYMGGLRDGIETRKKAEEKYKITIGGGNCYIVDLHIMHEMNLDGEILAHEAHEHEIDQYKKKGLIVEGKKTDEDHYRYLYIRHRIGPGQSDDAAFIIAGLLYNVDVAFGVFLADAIDTLEKYVWDYSDQDQDLSDYIKENYKDLGVTDDEVLQFAYLSAIPVEIEEEVPDSSLRYFLTTDKMTGQSTLSNHLNFIEGKPYFPITVSYKRILTTTFYRYIKKRLNLVKFGQAGADELKLELADKPASVVMEKTVITGSTDEQLLALLRRAKKAEAGTIVLKNKKGEIVGTIDPHDYLYLLEK